MKWLYVFFCLCSCLPVVYAKGASEAKVVHVQLHDEVTYRDSAFRDLEVTRQPGKDERLVSLRVEVGPEFSGPAWDRPIYLAHLKCGDLTVRPLVLGAGGAQGRVTPGIRDLVYRVPLETTAGVLHLSNTARGETWFRQQIDIPNIATRYRPIPVGAPPANAVEVRILKMREVFPFSVPASREVLYPGEDSPRVVPFTRRLSKPGHVLLAIDLEFESDKTTPNFRNWFQPENLRLHPGDTMAVTAWVDGQLKDLADFQMLAPVQSADQLTCYFLVRPEVREFELREEQKVLARGRR